MRDDVLLCVIGYMLGSVAMFCHVLPCAAMC
jgi:hypothetical protein